MSKMLIDRAVVGQALVGLEAACGGRCNAEYNPCWQRQMAEALRAALDETQESVVYMYLGLADAMGYDHRPDDLTSTEEWAAHLYAHYVATTSTEERTGALVRERNDAPAKLSVPHEWHTELATTCFARSYNGEGSYYCPHCDINAGSVWLEDAWRPTKWQAICDKCRELFRTIRGVSMNRGEMTDADIRRLAREVDGHMNDRSSGIDLPWESLIKIVRVAIAAEREACAKVCASLDETDTISRYDYRRGVLDCADAIRARGQG